MSDHLGRLPHDIEAERSILGAILLHNDALAAVGSILRPADFFRAAHRSIYRTMLTLADRREAIDLVTLRAELGPTELAAVGGPAYITALVDGMPRSTNVEHYAGIVKDAAAACALIQRNRAANETFSKDPSALRGEAGRQFIEDTRGIVEPNHRGTVVVPTFETLRDRLARPRPGVQYRIDGWWPQHSRAILAAQFKSGKTTLVDNVVRSLVDGDDFLGRDAVTPIDGTMAVLDFEMGEDQLDAWLEAQRIRNDDRVLVIPMRGRSATFNILDGRTRDAWALRFKASRVVSLVLDCLRPILDALGLDEHREAGRFLVALDSLLLEAGITETLVIHHMGHLGERSRGDSRLRDWPDVEWRLIRQDEDPASPRFLTAYGRDVDVPESQLHFDAETRRLTIAGGSRREAKAAVALVDVIGVLTAAKTPLSGRAVKQALADSDHARQTIEAALRFGLRTGAIALSAGAKNAKLYSPSTGSVPVSRSVPSVSRNGGSECPVATSSGTLAHSPRSASVTGTLGRSRERHERF